MDQCKSRNLVRGSTQFTAALYEISATARFPILNCKEDTPLTPVVANTLQRCRRIRGVSGCLFAAEDTGKRLQVPGINSGELLKNRTAIRANQTRRVIQRRGPFAGFEQRALHWPAVRIAGERPDPFSVPARIGFCAVQHLGSGDTDARQRREHRFGRARLHPGRDTCVGSCDACRCQTLQTIPGDRDRDPFPIARLKAVLQRRSGIAVTLTGMRDRECFAAQEAGEFTLGQIEVNPAAALLPRKPGGNHQPGGKDGDDLIRDN